MLVAPSDHWIEDENSFIKNGDYSGVSGGRKTSNPYPPAYVSGRDFDIRAE